MLIYKNWISLLTFFLFFPIIMFGQSYESMRVAEIEIVPQNLPPEIPFNSAALQSRLCTKVGNLFSQNEFDADLKLLAAEYDRIEPKIICVGDSLHLRLEIWLKPIIRSIIFCGNERVTLKKLQTTLDIAAGSLFDREEFYLAINKIRHHYFKKGFFEAEIDFQILPIGCGHEVDVQITIQEGRCGKIKEICFSGLTPTEETAVLDCMMTKNYQLLLSWYTGRGHYHPEMMEHDRLQILNFIQNLGYADAVVDICIAEVPGCDRIILQIHVEKGIQYRFGVITIVGNCLFPNEVIEDLLFIQSGFCFSPDAIRDSVQAIMDLYGSNGYIDASVDVQLSLREDCPVYDANIVILESEQYTVGLVRVFGNVCTQNRVILHENLLCPGDLFDIRRIQATEARLVNTGYFSSVNVYAVRSQLEDPCGEKNYRDVYIEVEETDTGSVTLCGGFSSIDRFFVGLDLSERNFNIAGLPHLFQYGPRALRGGGEYARIKANIGDRQTTYLLQWSKPYFWDTPWIVGFDVEKNSNRGLSHAYTLKTFGGSVHGTYIFNDYLKYSLYYRALRTDVSVSDDKKNVDLGRAAKQEGLISAAGMTFIYDSTNSPRCATSGLRSRMTFELAGLGGHFHFMKFAYVNTFYYPLSRRGTLKFRADVQFIKPYANTRAVDVPLSERFFLGGETTVRGYRPYIIGPKFAPNEPAGGISAYLLSEEYQYNLLDCPRLDAFVFMDAGGVSLKELHFPKHVASVGFGIRIEIMRNTPITLGIGWPIHPGEKFHGETISNAQRFFFAMGGCF